MIGLNNSKKISHILQQVLLLLLLFGYIIDIFMHSMFWAWDAQKDTTKKNAASETEIFAFDALNSVAKDFHKRN